MKTDQFILLVSGVAILVAGCRNPDGTQNNTGSGLLLGGALGALAGAAIGGPRHAGTDALIGAAAGAVAGGVVGNSMDREQDARLRSQAPQTYARINQGQPLSLADVKALARAGVSEDIIINQINNSRTIYHLSTADIIDLRDAGVTDKVINYMINTPTTVVAELPPVQVAPPSAPADVVVASPGPDYIWVDGEWTWNGGWVWVGGHWMLPPYPRAVWIHGRSWHDDRGWHYDRGYWR